MIIISYFYYKHQKVLTTRCSNSSIDSTRQAALPSGGRWFAHWKNNLYMTTNTGTTAIRHDKTIGGGGGVPSKKKNQQHVIGVSMRSRVYRSRTLDVSIERSQINHAVHAGDDGDVEKMELQLKGSDGDIGSEAKSSEGETAFNPMATTSVQRNQGITGSSIELV